MKMFRLAGKFKGEQFDPDKPIPEDVVFARRNGNPVYLWRNSTTGTWREIKPGDWIFTSVEYGRRDLVEDDMTRRIYEEIPDAGEGGGQVHPDPVA
ncbi:MAG TPA: hypothetical protein VMZ71_05245 [Gemmataceae bacterium]|nr:hypothetical protein [Gemmataceae bacterium]